MKRLLLLYPQAWRERYQTEMEAVLEGIPFDPRAALDLVACAVDAHLHPPGGRRRTRLPVLVLAALLAVAGTLAVPQVLSLIEAPVLHALDGWPVAPLLPAAIPALGALASWRAGWSLGAWFWGLFAVQVGLAGANDLLWDLLNTGRTALEPLRLAAEPWHPVWFRLAWPYAAALILLGGGLPALVLRRIGVRWPIGLGIGVLLVGCTGVGALYSYFRPSWFWPLGLAQLAQLLAWAALTAAFVRRAGLPWWAGLLTGVSLWLLVTGLLGFTRSTPGLVTTLWAPTGAVWAATLAALVTRPREAGPHAVVHA